MSELLPCPFCGGPAETRPFHTNGNTQSRCARTLCVGNLGGWNYTELWNTRTPSPKVDMGPCGLSEEEDRRAVEEMGKRLYDSLGLPHDNDKRGGFLSRLWLMTDQMFIRPRRLLSSTPPDPSSAAREAVIEAAKLWAKDYEDGTEASHPEETRMNLRNAVARLAALDQERPKP